MVFLRSLYRRSISRSMIGVVAEASLWLARQPAKVVDRNTVGLALFRAVLKEKPAAVCAALASYGVTVEELLGPTEADRVPRGGAEPPGKVDPGEAAGAGDPAWAVLYSRALTECLGHWMDLAEVEASVCNDWAIRPEHVLLALLEADGPWTQVLVGQGLSPKAVRAGIGAEVAKTLVSARQEAAGWVGRHARAEWSGAPAAGVPRRFGAGGMLVIVTMFGLLYGALQWLRAPPGVFLGAAVFFAGLALAQMLFRGGRFPRAASVITGAILWPTELFFIMLYHDRKTPGGLRFYEAWEAWMTLVMNVPIGALLGYLGGCLVAGVVLVLDMVRDAGKRLRRSRKVGQAAISQSEAPPAPSS